MISPETRMMGLPYGEGIIIVGRTTWTQSTSVTDGRTDRQTDRITITKTVQRRASHGKNEACLDDKVACISGLSSVRNVTACRPNSSRPTAGINLVWDLHPVDMRNRRPGCNCKIVSSDDDGVDARHAGDALRDDISTAVGLGVYLHG